MCGTSQRLPPAHFKGGPGAGNAFFVAGVNMIRTITDAVKPSKLESGKQFQVDAP
jgi:hypothetical protein